MSFSTSDAFVVLPSHSSGHCDSRSPNVPKTTRYGHGRASSQPGGAHIHCSGSNQKEAISTLYHWWEDHHSISAHQTVKTIDTREAYKTAKKRKTSYFHSFGVYFQALCDTSYGSTEYRLSSSTLLAANSTVVSFRYGGSHWVPKCPCPNALLIVYVQYVFNLSWKLKRQLLNAHALKIQTWFTYAIFFLRSFALLRN